MMNQGGGSFQDIPQEALQQIQVQSPDGWKVVLDNDWLAALIVVCAVIGILFWKNPGWLSALVKKARRKV